MPGFCDCNVDFVNWAAKQEVLNLSSCQTLSDIISALASYSRINPKPLRNWYIAKNLPDGIEINHDDIDNVVSEIPCLIFGNGFAILNTQAMILLNSNEDMLEKENANINKILPKLSHDDIIYLVKTYSNKLPSLGISEIWINIDPEHSEIFSDEIYDSLPFRLRCNFKFTSSDALEEFLSSGLRTGDGHPKCRIGAAIIPDNIDPYEQKNMIYMAHMSGLQVICGFNKTCLNVIERVNRKTHKRSRDLIKDPELNVYERLKVPGSGGIITRNDKNLKSAFQKGIVFCAGSPENELIPPLKNISDFMKENLSAGGALSFYTWGAAWNGKTEHRRGEISQGNDADIVILERDPFLIRAEEVGTIDIAMTFCAGNAAYNSGALM